MKILDKAGKERIKEMGILLYIDPGTGAVLFSLLMGVFSTVFFLMRKFIINFKFVLSAGKTKRMGNEVIPFVIFSDSKRYWNVFKPICDEFEARKVDCQYWTASQDDPAFDESYSFVKTKFIGKDNSAFATLNLMEADICLATTPGLDVYQWKRSKNTKYYVHIVHMVSELSLYRMFGIDFFDSILVASSLQGKVVRELEKLRNLSPKELIVVGSTYMDSLWHKKELNLRTLSDVRGGGTADITVLAAPSWGDSSILNRYGEKFLQALVDTGYRIIVRPHPQSFISDKVLMESLMVKFPNGDKFEWNRDNDNFRVLSESDIMISDFSGVIFDYTMIFDKPIIYTDTQLDLSPYDAAWIDAPLWQNEIMPRVGVELRETDFPNLKEVIDSLLVDEQYAEGRKFVRNIAWEYKNDAAKLTVDYLIKKRNELR